MQTECAYKVGASFIDYPFPQSRTVVHRSSGGDEDANTSFTQLADVLGYTEIVYVMKLLAQILVACRVINSQSWYKWYIGDGKVYAAILNVGLLKSLYIDLCVGVEQ